MELQSVNLTLALLGQCTCEISRIFSVEDAEKWIYSTINIAKNWDINSVYDNSMKGFKKDIRLSPCLAKITSQHQMCYDQQQG